MSKAAQLLGLAGALTATRESSSVKQRRRPGTRVRPGCWSGRTGGSMQKRGAFARKRSRERMARRSRMLNRRAGR